MRWAVIELRWLNCSGWIALMRLRVFVAHQGQQRTKVNSVTSGGQRHRPGK